MTKSSIMTVGLIVFLAAPLSRAEAQYAVPPPPPPAPGATQPPPDSGSCGPSVRCGVTPHYPRYRVRPNPLSYRPPCARGVRPCPSCRCPRNKVLHKRGGPYLGFGGGYFTFLRPEGAYQFLKPRAALSMFLGWNFNPIFALELGYHGNLFGEQDHALGDVKMPGLFGVTLDLKVRLVRPRRFTRVIPYLQTGLGVYFMQGTLKSTTECEDEKSLNMAHGGGFQLGGGLDIYLARWFVLGARVLYKPLLLSRLQCGPGDGARCGEFDAAMRRLHGLTAEVTLSLTLPD